MSSDTYNHESWRPPWAHRTAYACWTMERLEHVELVAARYGIRIAAPLEL